MPIRKVIDSNIIIYSLLENHPAYQDCVNYLLQNDEENVLFSTINTLYEVFQILHIVYQISSNKIIEKLNQLYNSSIHFLDIMDTSIWKSLDIVSKSKIQINDALLYLLATEIHSPMIVTDDRKFGNYIYEKKLIWETPISQKTRSEMDEWEKQNLPQKGLSRILNYVFQYLEINNKDVANKFRMDTKNFTKYPRIL